MSGQWVLSGAAHRSLLLSLCLAAQPSKGQSSGDQGQRKGRIPLWSLQHESLSERLMGPGVSAQDLQPLRGLWAGLLVSGRLCAHSWVQNDVSLPVCMAAS